MPASSSSNSWILPLKVLLISAGVVIVAEAGKLAIPLMFNFALNDFPAIWSAIVSLFEPPYLYVIVNGIIITIVAFTRFQTNHHQENQSQQQVNYSPFNALRPSDPTSDVTPVSIHLNFGVTEAPPVVYDIKPDVMAERVVYECKRADMDVKTVAMDGPEIVEGNEDAFNTMRSTWNPSQSVFNSTSPPTEDQPEFIFPGKEKQFVTSRSANHRKPAKIILEGARALRALHAEKHDTLDSTWKMITECRRMPSKSQFRKSNNFDILHYDCPSEESTAAVKTKVMKKSETFKDRTTYENQNYSPQSSSSNLPPASLGKLRKDLSLSQDELNQRVEAFIKKFNDDMRLQRQESLNQYLKSEEG